MTYKEEIAYFEALATKNKLVNHREEEPHFLRLNVFSLDQILIGKNNFPLIAFEKPSYPLNGFTYSMSKQTIGSFLVLNMETDKHKLDLITDIEEQTIIIAEQFIAKMIEDSKSNVFKTLDLNAFQIDIIPAPIADKLYGCRVSYSYKTSMKEYNNNDWL